jgi:hypothetical protein
MREAELARRRPLALTAGSSHVPFARGARPRNGTAGTRSRDSSRDVASSPAPDASYAHPNELA